VGERSVEVMHCNGLGNKITKESVEKMARSLKRYELKKLRSYIGIIRQLGDALDFANLCPLPRGYCGDFFVCDGEAISRRQFVDVD
jgi:hypothetical protein